MAANRDWVDDVKLEGVVGPEVFSNERKDEQIWRIIDTARAHGVNLLELAHACHAVWLACAHQMAQRADALGYGKSPEAGDE